MFTTIRCLLLFSLSIIVLQGCNGLFHNEIKTTFDQQGGSVEVQSYQFSIQLSDELAQSLGVNVLDNDRCAKIAADSDGNVYCTGYSESELLETNANNSRDMIFFKMNKSGVIQWIKHVGAETAAAFAGGDSTGSDECYDAAVNGDYLYCLGVTNSSLVDTHTSGSECVLLKIDKENGSIILAKQFANFACRGFGINNDAIYIGGGTSGSLYETSGGSNDIAIVKVDHSFNVIWERQLGSVTGGANGLTTTGNDFCQTFNISSDGEDLYCGAKVSYSFAETNGGSNDFLVVKYSKDGDFQWAKQLGADSIGSDSSGNEVCWSIAVNSLGPICGGRTTGDFADTNTGSGLSNTAMFQLDKNSGALLWRHQIGLNFNFSKEDISGENSGVCSHVMVDDSDNSYCVGRFDASLFDDAGGAYDIGLLKLDSSGSFIWGHQVGLSESTTDLTQYDTAYGSVLVNNTIYLGGETSGSPFAPNGGEKDLVVTTVDPETGNH